MKKLILACFIVVLFSSCGMVFGGKLTKCQWEKPEGVRRQIRPFALIGDILSGPFMIIAIPVDFVTGGIYRPCNYTKTVKKNFKL
jgi:hypothetical protein